MASVKNRKKINSEAGFTIVELLIASAVFSLVLLLCALAIMQVGKMFYKGTITTRTQDASRKTVEDVANSIRFGLGDKDPQAFYRTGSQNFGLPDGSNVTMRSACIGSTRFSYITDRALGTGPGKYPHILWKDTLDTVGGACPVMDLNNPNVFNDSAANDGGQEMLGNDMRVPVFNITRPPAGTFQWQVNIRISYGATLDLFETGSNFGICVDSESGGQFCSVSEFTTRVARRL